MSAGTVTLGNRIDANLKREFDATANEMGISPTSAISVFMKRFVLERGFPFDTRLPVPTSEEFAREMDRRYDELAAGNAQAHDLIEL